MHSALDSQALQTLFTAARSHNGWQDQPVSDETLRKLYDLLKWGPTANNCCPARFFFVRSTGAKERLRPALRPNNVEKALLAPVVAIVATDSAWTEQLPRLFPAYDVQGQVQALPEPVRQAMALRNGSLQGGYLIMAARALGLDCGPMAGFDNGVLDQEFFPDGQWKSSFICALGYGNASKLRPRGPRLEFDEACRLA
jgi:3-hydroxypropanoate dehydrogenase